MTGTRPEEVLMENRPAQDSTNRLLAALAYPIWIIALIIVVTDMKKDPFMRNHGWTAVFWAVAWLIIWVGLQILARIPFLGFLLFLFTAPIFWLGLVGPAPSFSRPTGK